MSPEGAPIIVSALFAPADQAWLDGLRRAHFPPERNQLDAHLTLFHHLPPSSLAELRTRISQLAANMPPLAAQATELMSLGKGVAIRIACPALHEIRDAVADAFHGLLTPQDAGKWRPHVTIQNKVTPQAAAALLTDLRRTFVGRPLTIAAIGLYHYRGGPWEAIARIAFRG